MDFSSCSRSELFLMLFATVQCILYSLSSCWSTHISVPAAYNVRHEGLTFLYPSTTQFKHSELANFYCVVLDTGSQPRYLMPSFNRDFIGTIFVYIIPYIVYIHQIVTSLNSMQNLILLNMKRCLKCLIRSFSVYLSFECIDSIMRSLITSTSTGCMH